MSDNNNVENDNESDYVYLKRPYLFNIRYNSRQVWNKLPEEEKTPYANYEEVLTSAALATASCGKPLDKRISFNFFPILSKSISFMKSPTTKIINLIHIIVILNC